MHALVDGLDFTDLLFTEALRNFLQCFRLPGESQKIDRFMLKFAERFVACNAQTVFKNAGSCETPQGMLKEITLCDRGCLCISLFGYLA